MVHRALLGSVERFFGILIEHYAGAFPLWLAPVQVEICPVSEKVIDYAGHVRETLKNHNIRVHLDDRNEKLPAKIRDAQLQKIPYMLVVGPKEAEAGTVDAEIADRIDEAAIEPDLLLGFAQRRVVLAALGLLESSEEPGTILDLPIKWADVRREAKTLTEQGRKL